MSNAPDTTLPFAKGLFFGLVITGTGVAVYNNWLAIQALGLSPLGAA